MKNPIDLYFKTPLPLLFGQHVGDLEIHGRATCDHPKDTDSYDYELSEVMLIKNGMRVPFLDYITSQFGEPCKYSVLHNAVIAHMMFEYGVKDYDETTDRSQDINIFGQEPYKSVA